MSRALLEWTTRFLLCNYGLRKLKKLIWGSKSLLVLSEKTVNSQGTIYVNPLNLLRYGVVNNQIVQIFITFRTRQGCVKHEERVMRVVSLMYIPKEEFLLGSDDIYNIFDKDPITFAKLDTMRPFTFDGSNISRRPIDSIRLAPVKTNRKISSSFDFAEDLTKVFRTPRIIYQHDVLTMITTDKFTKEKSKHCFRVDCFQSPCIVDLRTSVYETASVNQNIPYGDYADFKKILPTALPEVPRPLFTIIERMRDLLYASEHIREEPLVLLLVGSAGAGKRLLVKRFSELTHQNLIEINCFDIWSDIPAQTEAKLKLLFDKAKNCQPCIIHFSNVDVLGFDPNSSEIDHRVISTVRNLLDDQSRLTVIFSCRSDLVTQLSSSLLSIALYHFSIEHLNEEDRLIFLSHHFSTPNAQFAARHTSGFSIAELNNFLTDVTHILKSKGEDLSKAIQSAIDKRNSSFADAIGAPKIPSVLWDDVGGLEETKQIVIESIEGHLNGGKSLKRSGVILFGPPGCGKTLIAKAVATEFKIAFLSVKGPELLNKYVGQSEENLRKVFERARQASPCVIFFDELDSLAPNRGRSGDSGGVMDRIVSQLLAELDTLHDDPQCKVFVMAATNRADLLDPSLLTPGRFDKVVNVSPGKNVEDKKKILEAVSRKMRKASDVDVSKIAALCPDSMSGAELYSLVSTATMKALREQINAIEAGRMRLSDAEVIISQNHLEDALDNVISRKKMATS
ncbi:unnamed protein product [Auanema sp. JU1783]|nr:unnamed protein product [Auanema sp. JU1783]